MMKKLLSFVALILLIFTMIGCTPKNPSGNNEDPNDQNPNGPGVGDYEEIY